ncbi:MAG TPA: C13 family peptidase [Stellaceae bacterium]|nr:C13 family peptidase [Stellaceae bacterium]
MAPRFRSRVSARVLARGLGLGLGLVLLAGGVAAATRTVPRWQVVLAAGDDAEPVFDDATRALARRLAAAGVPAADIHRLSASRSELHGGVEPATAARLLQEIARLPARPGDRCLVFLTSHGERGEGLWLARSDRALHPDELARALSRGCAAAPTVVIVSGCYTGSFAAGAMRRPNRIILTAARADRPSFGCQTGRVYTFFDQCLLAALPGAPGWQAVFDATKRCVTREEHALGMPPSLPQGYFGPRVARLGVGF